MDPATTERDAAYFAALTRELLREPEEPPTFQLVAERAVEVVPACEHGGISLRRRRHTAPGASSSSLAARCDELQHELDEGPCRDAVWHDDAYLVTDTASDTRWPRWCRAVAGEGVRSALSIRLATERETIGALNLYAEQQHAFTEEDVDIALVYTAHATNALRTARLVTGLSTSVRSRHLIGVAQGILMTRYGVGLDNAFEVLRRYSVAHHVKLRDLAETVVETGELPAPDPGT